LRLGSDLAGIVSMPPSVVPQLRQIDAQFGIHLA